MARINSTFTYAFKSTVAGTDYVIGTNSTTGTLTTVNFQMSDIKTYANKGFIYNDIGQATLYGGIRIGSAGSTQEASLGFYSSATTDTTKNVWVIGHGTDGSTGFGIYNYITNSNNMTISSTGKFTFSSDVTISSTGKLEVLGESKFERLLDTTDLYINSFNGFIHIPPQDSIEYNAATQIEITNGFDWTTLIHACAKVMWIATTSGVLKSGTIISSSYSTNTVLTIFGDTPSTGGMTNFVFSYMDAPAYFPHNSNNSNTRCLTKKLTGNTAGTEGGTATVAHNVTSSNIISCNAIVFHTADSGCTPGQGAGGLYAGYQFDVSFDATNVSIYNSSTNSENILTKPFVVWITYIV